MMEPPRISIIIPAYNEEKRLPGTLRAINDWRPSYLHEVIVVDDGSADATAAVARAEGAMVISLARNSGKGAAVREGIRTATGEAVVMYDADAAVPPQDIGLLVQRHIDTHAQVVIGSRVLGGSVKSMTPMRRFTGRVFHALCAPLLPGIADASCGCKLFSLPLAKEISNLQRLDRFAFDVEYLMLARKLGESIEEVPVRWTAMPGSRVRVLRDGCEMILRVASLYMRVAFLRSGARERAV